MTAVNHVALLHHMYLNLKVFKTLSPEGALGTLERVSANYTAEVEKRNAEGIPSTEFPMNAMHVYREHIEKAFQKAPTGDRSVNDQQMISYLSIIRDFTNGRITEDVAAVLITNFYRFI